MHIYCSGNGRFPFSFNSVLDLLTALIYSLHACSRHDFIG